jgi:hypothetical protein
VVDEKLRSAAEKVRERGAPFIGIETVLLVDANPRQLLASPRQFVAAPRQFLFLLEQLRAASQSSREAT